MLCASKFLHDRLCITRQDTTIQPCGSATFQQSSVILYLLVPLCICKGTLIMQSLQPSMITGGCSGWLRQEFRDLEILDEITRLAVHSQLVPEINGHCRNTLIRQFRTWKGLNYMPDNYIQQSSGLHKILILLKQMCKMSLANCESKEILNSKLNNSMIKASNSFTAAKAVCHFCIRLSHLLY